MSFKHIYSVDNKALLDALDEEMMSCAIPCYIAVVHDLLRMSKDIPASILLTNLKILYSFMSLEISSIIHTLFYDSCWKIVNEVHSCTVQMEIRSKTPDYPLLVQYAVEHCVFRLFLEESVNVYDSHKAVILVQMFEHHDLSYWVSEVQLGVISGVHFALDKIIHLDSSLFLLEIIGSILVKLTKNNADHNSVNVFRFGMSEPVLESALALLCRIFRSHLLGEVLRSIVKSIYPSLWASLYQTVSPSTGMGSKDAVLLKHTSHSATALELMGWMISCKIKDGWNNFDADAGLLSWVRLLQYGCRDEQPLQIRLFCAKALQASQLLRMDTRDVGKNSADGASVACVLYAVWTLGLNLIQVNLLFELC